MELRRNEQNRGLSYSPDPDKTTLANVREYMDGFGWCGVGAREVTRAVQRDERGVKRALKALCDDGELRYEETLTRGAKASRRKVYFTLARTEPFIGSASEQLLYSSDRPIP